MTLGRKLVIWLSSIVVTGITVGAINALVVDKFIPAMRYWLEPVMIVSIVSGIAI